MGRCCRESATPEEQLGLVARPRAWGQQGQGVLCLSSVPSVAQCPRGMVPQLPEPSRTHRKNQGHFHQVFLKLPINSR